MFCSTTSELATICLTSSRPSCLRRSRVTERLPRLRSLKTGDSSIPPLSEPAVSECTREWSSRARLSILITSAPSMPSSSDPCGPAHAQVKSQIRMPASGRPPRGGSAPQDRIRHRSSYRTWSGAGDLNLLHSALNHEHSTMYLGDDL